MKQLVPALVLILALPLVGAAAQMGKGGPGATTNAQGTGGNACELCYDYPGGGGISGPSGGGHGFGGNECSSPGPAGDAFCMDCHAFNACHDNIQNKLGGCRSWHWYCGLNHAFIEEIERAGEVGNTGILLVSARADGGSVDVSVDGEYFLIRDCERNIVGAFRIQHPVGGTNPNGVA